MTGVDDDDENIQIPLVIRLLDFWPFHIKYFSRILPTFCEQLI